MAWPRSGTESRRRMSARHSETVREMWKDPAYRTRVVRASAEGRRKYPRDLAPCVIQAARRHHVTPAQYLAVVSQPCEVCAAPPPSHLDHDHMTGAVRGALCGNCNRVLGILREDVALILKLADYASRVKTKDVLGEEVQVHG